MSGPAVEILPVRTAREREAFIRFPWQVQAADPCWVPPLVSRQREFLDPRRGPFFEFGEAECFLARRGGRWAGRISAQVSRRHDEFHGAGTGFFGFFECEDDPEAAGALLRAAADWVRARGRQRLVGPMSFSIYDDIGLLVDGFDSVPALLLTHNPPWYAELVAAQGFRKAVDWHALRVTNTDIDPAAMQTEAAEIIKRSGLVLRMPSPAEMVRRSDEILELFNEAWDGNWGHVPFTSLQFKVILGELRPLLRTDLIRLVLDGGRIVAFTITIPDLNPLIRRFDGRLSLWNMLRLYRAAQWAPLKRVKTVLLGVKPVFRNRRLHDAMILDTYAHLVRTQPGIEQCDCSLICEQLRVFIRSLERYGARPYKTYRIYEKEIWSKAR
ncbi:MAG TPA: hypothetical protein P5567_04820 [Kiritimatiellia bacterium]|nr:hypothetical protein [Kiritimatiellia bacterium]HRZ11761.1 hypothetical protein [Kiritimatiellia bacterium]HSA17432.1 hypothetical protein [Kiritimatiellia bacterium]